MMLGLNKIIVEEKKKKLKIIQHFLSEIKKKP